jgi:hypothetical protein
MDGTRKRRQEQQEQRAATARLSERDLVDSVNACVRKHATDLHQCDHPKAEFVHRETRRAQANGMPDKAVPNAAREAL